MTDLEVGSPARELAQGTPFRRLPDTVVRTYQAASFSPAVYGVTGYCWDTLDEWAELTRRASELSWARADEIGKTDPGYAAVIRDQVKKAQVNWRVHGYGAGLQLAPVTTEAGDAYTAAVTPYMQALAMGSLRVAESVSQAELAEWSVEKPYPIWKGKGAPSFCSGADWDLAPHLARMVDLSSTPSEKEIVAHTRASSQWGGSYWGATWFRAQGRSVDKPGPLWLLSGGDLIYQGETGLFPKTRKVTGIPFGINFWTAPVIACMRELMIRASGGRFAGTLDHSLRISRSYPSLLAADASNFDDSQPLSAISNFVTYAFEPVARMLYARGVLSLRWMRLAIVCMRYMIDVPCIVTPSWTGELGRLIQNKAGVLSGMRATSVLDTYLNQGLIRWLMEKKGGHKLGTTYDFDAFGDDTLVASRSAQDELSQLWEKHGNELGTTYKVSEEPAFLMRRMPSGTPYPDRFWFRTLNREPLEEATTPGAAAIGIQGRLKLVHGGDREHLLRVYNSWKGVNPRLDSALALAINGPDLTAFAFAPQRADASGGEYLEYLAELQDESQSALADLPPGLANWLATNRDKVAPSWQSTAAAAAQLSVAEATQAVRARAKRTVALGKSEYAIPTFRTHPHERKIQKRRG